MPPEFGTIAALVSAVAILSIISVSYKRGPQLQAIRNRSYAEKAYKINIGRYPHKSLSASQIDYVNSFYKSNV